MLELITKASGPTASLSGRQAEHSETVGLPAQRERWGPGLETEALVTNTPIHTITLVMTVSSFHGGIVQSF